LEGKRVLFEYFMDALLSEDTTKIRKCANIVVRPKHKLRMETMISATLRRILGEIRSIKYLSMTNLTKFVTNMLSPYIRGKISQETEDISELSIKDRDNYTNMIKVVVCSEKCPCCGRICGLEDEHQYHQCMYGHQMRGLNGTYIDRE
jgi:hypothetical protein